LVRAAGILKNLAQINEVNSPKTASEGRGIIQYVNPRRSWFIGWVAEHLAAAAILIFASNFRRFAISGNAVT